MHLMQVTMLEALHDADPAESDLKQLPSRYHPMLLARQPCHRLVPLASGRFDIDSASK